jgi:cellulose synthase/poly-beta-1,6-N-acetylglucosamine synthase-like glycosyltransferase
MELVKTEVILIFDADYIPGAGLIKQLVAPAFLRRTIGADPCPDAAQSLARGIGAGGG